MKVLLAGIVLVAALVGSFVLGTYRSSNSGMETEISSESKDYPLLAKRIFVENPNEPIVNFTALRKSLNDYFIQQNIEGSLYFEYLPTGTSIRIDGDKKEVAASLIKLPAVMELYKASELGKVNLDDEIQLKPEWLDNEFGNLYKRGAGFKLSLREAAKITLTDSDNTGLKAISSTLLAASIPLEENPFTFLDAEFSQNPDLTVSISARSYSSFLKCLYFSCYLNKDSSQEILEYLSETKFNNRLKAGFTDDIKLSHKVGNFGQNTQSDCGIVYLEKRNYVLCVMINGADNSETDRKIADISKLAFDFLK